MSYEYIPKRLYALINALDLGPIDSWKVSRMAGVLIPRYYTPGHNQRRELAVPPNQTIADVANELAGYRDYAIRGIIFGCLLKIFNPIGDEFYSAVSRARFKATREILEFRLPNALKIYALKTRLPQPIFEELIAEMIFERL